MRGLLQLTILAIVAYVGYTQVWPRWRAHQESRAAEQREEAGSRACLDAAESVADDFAREIRQFPAPPIDPSLWSTFMVETSSRLAAADAVCRCPAEACLTAATALLEQRKLLNQFDGVVRSTSTGISNPAASLERIQSLLARARTEAR